MTQIQNHKYTIDEAFRNCFYVVPDYQREYIWTEKQITQLLEDINEQFENDTSNYFIGNILVSTQNEESRHYDMIDGQQRLTTKFLILCALRTLFTAIHMPQEKMIRELTVNSYIDSRDNIQFNLKLQPKYENAGEVIQKIVDTNDDPQTVRREIQNSGIQVDGAVENILDAYDIIYRYLSTNYDNENKLKKYWTYLAYKVVFIQISTDISSALKIFETINERGVGLNPMDLLKNILFTQVSTEQFSKLKSKWKKITNPLEQNKEKPLRFLRYFIMANYEIKNEQNDATVRENEIYDWLSKKENAALTGYKEEPFKFVEKITDNVNSYTNFRKGHGNDGKPSLVMDSLKTLTGSAFSLHYVLLLAAANLPKSLFDQFVAHLESFLFFYIFTKTPIKDFDSNFSFWADEIRVIAHLENQKEQRKKLNEFVSERFAKSMEKKGLELEDSLKLLTLHSMQKYRIRYLLARLTQYVEMARLGQKDRIGIELYFKLEIEHILPDNPKDDLKKKWEQKHPELNYHTYKNRLGNLTLLEKPINRSIKNKPYSEKVIRYAESGNYLTSSLSHLRPVGHNTSISRINKKLSEFDKWDAEDIENRQLLLIGLAQEIWKITEITA